MLGGVIEKAEQARKDMYRYVSVTLIVTDGENTDQTPNEDVATLIKDLQGTRRDMVAGLAFDGQGGLATKAFNRWGIPSEWIFSGNSTPQEFADAIDRFIGVSLAAAAANTNEDLEKIIITGLLEAPKNLPSTQ